MNAAPPRTVRLPRWLQRLLLAALPFVIVGLLGLGFWQLSRLQQRRAQNALITARLAQPPVTVTAALFTPDLNALDYQPAAARGVFDPAQEIVWRNQARDGAPGVHVITPLQLTTGGALLVDRGWLPYTQADPAARAAYGAPAGEVAITGLLRVPAARVSALTPADPPLSAANPRLEAWFWLEVKPIQAQVPYPLAPLIFVEQGPPPAAGLPIPDPALDLSEGPHLMYALQWFTFAAIALLGPLVYWRQSRAAAGPPR